MKHIQIINYVNKEVDEKSKVMFTTIEHFPITYKEIDENDKLEFLGSCTLPLKCIEESHGNIIDLVIHYLSEKGEYFI